MIHAWREGKGKLDVRALYEYASDRYGPGSPTDHLAMALDDLAALDREAPPSQAVVRYYDADGELVREIRGDPRGSVELPSAGYSMFLDVDEATPADRGASSPKTDAPSGEAPPSLTAEEASALYHMRAGDEAYSTGQDKLRAIAAFWGGEVGVAVSALTAAEIAEDTDG